MNSVRRCTLSLLLLIFSLSPMSSARVLEEVFPQLSQSQIQVLLDGKMLQGQTLGPIEHSHHPDQWRITRQLKQVP